MTDDFLSACRLLAEYGALADSGMYDDWLALFATDCSYYVMPRENHDLGLPASLIFCDSRPMLEDRIRALRQVNRYNIHGDRHLIGLPRIMAAEPDHLIVEAPFTVFQTEQEGETRLFAAGLYRTRFERHKDILKIHEKRVLLDSFAVPSLLATPL